MSSQLIRVFVHPHDGDQLLGKLNVIVPMKTIPRVGEYIMI